MKAHGTNVHDEDEDGNDFQTPDSGLNPISL
jgi:hypothetical protein